MKKLFFVRHGETEMNVAGLLSGRTETPLTPRGIEQAKAAGKEIKEKLPHIDLIICSPYGRTFETAQLIAEAIDYPVNAILKNELLIERTFGVLEGTNGKDFLATHAYRDFDEVEGAETIEELDKRATQALNHIKGLEADNILIVGHGAFSRAIRRVITGLPYTHEYEIDTSIGNATVLGLI